MCRKENREVLQERKEARNNHHIELFMRKYMQYLHIRYEFNRNLFFQHFSLSYSLYIGTLYFKPEGFDKNKLSLILQSKVLRIICKIFDAQELENGKVQNILLFLREESLLKI